MSDDRRHDDFDRGSFGGHPYTPTEIAMGYGTDDDPRFRGSRRESRHMNAIERLRDLTDWVGTAEPERTERESALAAVDDLYQAAKNDRRGHSRDCDGSNYPCSCGLDALDAAVRKVEGDA